MPDLDRVSGLVRRALESGEAIFLLLDYDGTLVELQDSPDQALPTPRVLFVVRALVEKPRVKVVMVSGRSASQLSKLLPIRGLTYYGAYGAQVKRDGAKPAWHPRVRALRPVISKIHAALRKDLRGFRNLILEDKWGCIGIQARTLSAADRREVVRRARARMEGADSKGGLHLTENAYGLEIGARGIDKGWSVSEALLGRTFLGMADVRSADRVGSATGFLPGRNGLERHPLAIYIGDDTSDEAAFRALEERGVAIRVGKPRATAARYRLANPARVLTLLEGIAADA